MLIAAAAAQWRVSPASCRTEPGHVVHAASGRRVSYGAVAEAAARQPVPGRDMLNLKNEDMWRYIGKSLPIVDLDDIVHGRATYGIDVVLPGMTYASVERSPVYGATLKSVDSTEAMKVSGVLHVVRIFSAPLPAGFRPLGGVARSSSSNGTSGRTPRTIARRIARRLKILRGSLGRSCATTAIPPER
jgi:isoquinoline 1-oxidoreductase beta subunit